MNQNLSNSNASGFDQFQPPQYPVIPHSPQETSKEVLKARKDLMKAIYTFLRKFSRIPFGVTPKVLLIAWERFGEIKHAFTDEHYQQEDIQEFMSKLLKDPKEITPDLPIKEPDNSLSMEDEHLNTILEMEKTSVENLVPIPSEFKGISEEICDVPSCDHFDAELLDSDFLVEEVDTFLVLEDSLPPGIESDLDSEGDIVFLYNLLNEDSIPEYERFTFDIDPDAPVINNFDELNEDECFDPGGEIDVEDDDSFIFIIRTFLPFLTYLVDSPLLLSTRSEDNRCLTPTRHLPRRAHREGLSMSYVHPNINETR
ncbi:hypothetical protein Tco_1327279 [Tanacetum coccineum]